MTSVAACPPHKQGKGEDIIDGNNKDDEKWVVLQRVLCRLSGQNCYDASTDIELIILWPCLILSVLGRVSGQIAMLLVRCNWIISSATTDIVVIILTTNILYILWYSHECYAWPYISTWCNSMHAYLILYFCSFSLSPHALAWYMTKCFIGWLFSPLKCLTQLTDRFELG